MIDKIFSLLLRGVFGMSKRGGKVPEKNQDSVQRRIEELETHIIARGDEIGWLRHTIPSNLEEGLPRFDRVHPLYWLRVSDGEEALWAWVEECQRPYQRDIAQRFVILALPEFPEIIRAFFADNEDDKARELGCNRHNCSKDITIRGPLVVSKSAVN